MKSQNQTFLCCSLLAVFALSCQGKNKDNDGPPSQSDSVASNVTLAIGLSTPTAFNLAGSATPTNCHLGVTPTIQADGLCITPSQVTLWVTGVSLATTEKLEGDAFRTAPVRLLGGGSGYGKDGYFEGADFDLSNLSSIRGSDNLWSTYDSRYTFKSLSIEIGYIKSTFVAGDRTWELMVPFINQPVEGETWLKDCFGAEWFDLAKTRGTILPNMNFKTGDMLVCKRQNATTPCTESEFQWADSATGALSSTRPETPKALSSVSKLNRKCLRPTSGSTPPDSQFDLPALSVGLNTPINFYGDFSHGPTSKSNPADFPKRATAGEWDSRRQQNLKTAPFTQYFFQENGQTISGDKLEAQIKINPTEYVFLAGLTSVSSSTADADIIKAMTTKEFWAWEKLEIGKLGDFTALKADLKVKVSNSSSVDDIYAGPTEGAKAQSATPL